MSPEPVPGELVFAGAMCENARMTDDTLYPFTIEVSPLSAPKGHYGWAIRKHGKLLERSDRPHDSEERAYASATAAVERAFRPADPRRR